ncbi:hydantoinase/oxoprolinase family protein [Mesorhizobium sp. M0244]|uniref:hydantoinase/oxoprolinase family protein n=1 Tax=Mesorhizobium sp. M0244 TaxID=2956926 RepID=UPI00333D2E56
MSYRIGVDVGGTFTDFALFNDLDHGIEFLKLLTTPADPSLAVLDGIEQITAVMGISVADVSDVRHATTIATNTIIQRNGPKTALITTQGFRDVQIIGRQRRAEIYDTSVDRPVPVVRRKYTWEVPERMLFDGTVHKVLDEDAVRRVAAEMLSADIESVGVCFLHSYANPAHEQRVAEILGEVAPSIAVTLSSEISPVLREYERGSTTTLNAYVVPPVQRYVKRLVDGLRERGYKGELLIMQSNGGIATPEIVKKFPIRIVESGPAAGVLTAARYTKAAGNDIISFDMGGTTAKVCMIEDGKPFLAGQFEVDMVNLKPNSGLPIDIPAIDLVEIGSGGGSIARIEMGSIKVGPESASSVPGPICYGRGGTRPTVTDADVILGYINPDYFLGGKMSLDRDAASKGIQTHVGDILGIDTAAAAWGIFEVVTAQMAEAARVVSVGRGKDPRDFSFIPFGGAGPVHGGRIARMLGCTRIVFPSGAGVQSAVGLLMGDVRFDLARTLIVETNDANVDQVTDTFELLVEEARRQIAAGSFDGRDVHFTFSADMRFVGQGYEINVELPSDDAAASEVRDAFFKVYGKTYGERTFSRDDSVEFVKLHLSARVELPKLTFPDTPALGGSADKALKNHRSVYFPETNGFAECPVYDRYLLKSGERFKGPALVEEHESTIVILPNSLAQVDRSGNIIVDLH